VQELRVAQEEARKLILANIESEQQDQVESMPHWSRTWEAGDQVMLGADHKGKGQSKASRSPATMDGVRNPRNTTDGVQAGRGRWKQWLSHGIPILIVVAFQWNSNPHSGGFPMEFQSPYSRNSSQRWAALQA
jgi:hypothetical protein